MNAIYIDVFERFPLEPLFFISAHSSCFSFLWPPCSNKSIQISREFSITVKWLDPLPGPFALNPPFVLSTTCSQRLPKCLAQDWHLTNVYWMTIIRHPIFTPTFLVIDKLSLFKVNECLYFLFILVTFLLLCYSSQLYFHDFWFCFQLFSFSF